MGLLRTAFWVVVIILLLPTNHDDQKKAYSLAKATVGDISSFCDRNPGTCHQGQEAFVVFKDDVIARFVLFYQIGFENERFFFRAGDDGLDIIYFIHQDASFNVLVSGNFKIGSQALF